MKGITSSGARALSRALARNRGLQRINLARNSLSDEGVGELCAGLAQNQGTLQYLDLTETGCAAQGVQAIAELILAGKCGLVSLNLAGNEGITAPGNGALWDALRVKGDKVKSLVLKGCTKAWDAECVDRMAAALHSDTCGLCGLVLDSAPFGALGIRRLALGYAHVHLCTSTCARAQTFVCGRIHTHACGTHKYTCIYIYIYIYCTCIYTCINML
jgi:hypothetical protein